MKVVNMKFLTDEQKQLLLNDPFVARMKGHIHSALVVNSLRELIEKGFTRTGRSGCSGGYSTKNVWSNEVLRHALTIGLNVEKDNDAPRGGANGELVRVVDSSFSARINDKIVNFVKK